MATKGRVYQLKEGFWSISILKYFRLYPLEAEIYRSDEGFWIVAVPGAHCGVVDTFCACEDGIEQLIFRGVLIPDIVSDKEYLVQRAVGSVDHRTYRLQSKTAAKYQFSCETLATLRMIENLIELCDYNIFDDSRGLQVDGQKYLEIIPRDGIIVKDHKGDIITDPTNEMHYVDQSSFDDMSSRGIIVLQGTKWKLSRKYWEFRL